AAVCLGVVGVIARAYRPKSESDPLLPPSLPTWRPGGHFLPHRRPSLTIAEGIDEYGPLIIIRSRLEKIVIIGRYKAAVDIMENQGKLTADPSPHYCCWRNILRRNECRLYVLWGQVPSNAALHLYLKPKATEAYQPLRMSHVKNTVLGILDDPHSFQNHVRTKTTPTSATDPEFPEIRRHIKMASALMRPGTYPARQIQHWSAGPRKRVNVVHLLLKAHFVAEPFHSRAIWELALSIYVAKIRRKTSATICTVLMAAAYFPEEQAKVQAELDAVIGRHRARTTLFGNHWSISRDPDVYPEPDVFKPQRWIDDQGHLRNDLKLFVFGFGRGFVFINSLLIIWAFQLTLDPTMPLDDMGFMSGAKLNDPPCAIEFETRIPELECKNLSGSRCEFKGRYDLDNECETETGRLV
ncbi:cytochrome P450, partial [Suillus subluteus]